MLHSHPTMQGYAVQKMTVQNQETNHYANIVLKTGWLWAFPDTTHVSRNAACERRP
jgi:hypothetical protein